ncbi:MAG: phage integrase SAM-like domain-containing protein, partial [Ruminococcus sp.]|nr:phage integrase SAM-like domain-containing protein [Ruminococcus sp.]
MKTRLYLDTRKGAEPFPLSLVISRKGQSAYINLGVSLTAEQWNADTRTVADLPPKRWPQRDIVRNVIDRKRTAIETALMSLEVDGRLHGLTALQVRDAVLRELGNTDTTPVLFLDYYADVVGRYSGRTRELYEATLTKIRQTIPDAHALTLDDITPAWLTMLDKRMSRTSPSRNARNIHLRNIRRVMNCAIDDELTHNYPFRKFKFKYEETEERALTLDQLRNFLTAEVDGYLAEYRDIFELSFYLLGINLTDLANLTATSVKGDRLEYVRAKTKKRYSVKIEPEAWAIIERHKGKDWLIDIHDRYRNVHDYLKHIDAGLKKILPGYPFDQLTTYWARHTVATLMVNELDVPIETVSAALGHRYGSRVTAVYVHFDRQKVDVANRRLIDLINKRAAGDEH